ncbi:hypothetical protein Aduo_019072 [Ancylostoma duodenale]
MAGTNNSKNDNAQDRGDAARNEPNEVEMAEARPQQATGTPPPLSNWREVMKCIAMRCDSALTEQLRNLSSAKREYIVEAVQCAVEIAVAAVERENAVNEQFCTVLSALGLQPQELLEMLPRLTRHAADLKQLANELGCDIASKQGVRHPSAESVPQKDGLRWNPQLNCPERSVRSSTTCSHLDPQDLPGEFSDLTSLSGDSKNGRTETVSTFEGQDNQVISALREVLKAQTVADVKKYTGKNSLSDFSRALEVKYPKTVWSDSDRRDILINHLEGTAKALVSNLPDDVRHGTFDALVQELKKARITPGERLRAASEWKQLRKNDQESVVDYCCRMKEIAKRMHPNQDMDFELGRKLYESLSDWPDSYYMLAALDSPEGRIFDEVRKVALRLERTREAGQVSKAKTWRERQAKGRSGKTLQESGEDSSHQSHEHTSKDSRTAAKCFHCGEKGHFSRWCPKRRADVPASSKPSRPASTRQSQEKLKNQMDKRPARGSFSTHLQSWCCKVDSNEGRTPTEAYGQPCYCDVIVFGIKTKALIDTGSTISIIPVGFLKRAQETGADLDQMVTMMGDGNETQVYDASGNPMKFLMRIATDVKVCGARATTAQLRVQQSRDEVIMLGTNVLGALGIQVTLNPSTDSCPCQHSESLSCAEKRKKLAEEPEASVVQRVLVPPFSVATIQLASNVDMADRVFWSNDDRIASGVCRISEGLATVW